jgi:hypothetical protein
VNEYHLGYCLTVVLMIAISIPLAWLLSKLTSVLEGQLLEQRVPKMLASIWPSRDKSQRS